MVQRGQLASLLSHSWHLRLQSREPAHRAKEAIVIALLEHVSTKKVLLCANSVCGGIVEEIECF